MIIYKKKLPCIHGIEISVQQKAEVFKTIIKRERGIGTAVIIL
jgi:hypothetical protein